MGFAGKCDYDHMFVTTTFLLACPPPPHLRLQVEVYILHFKVTPRVTYARPNPICNVAACNRVGLDENKMDLREKDILYVICSLPNLCKTRDL